MKLSAAVSFLCVASASAFAPTSIKTSSVSILVDDSMTMHAYTVWDMKLLFAFWPEVIIEMILSCWLDYYCETLFFLHFSLQSTKLFNDPNQNPFGAYNAAAVPAAPVAAAPVAAPAAPAAGGDANQNVFGTKSLEFQGNESDDSFKTVRLRDRLNEADTERRKDEEAADLRERASEIAREERLKKIAYMENMPDETPAGTGKSSQEREQ
jgi:hypothetical protein